MAFLNNVDDGCFHKGLHIISPCERGTRPLNLA